MKIKELFGQNKELVRKIKRNWGEGDQGRTVFFTDVVLESAEIKSLDKNHLYLLIDRN